MCKKFVCLTFLCISGIILSLMFAGQSYAQIDRETILGAWLLDEGQGDITEDASGNGNDGTLMNAPTWIDGVYGKALQFSGPSTYVDCGNAEALSVEVFSVSFWYNFPSTQYWNHMISKGSHVASGTPGSVNWGVMMYDAEQRILFETYNNTSWTAVIADTTTGQWHHVVATFDGSTMQLYHDGQLAGTSGGGIFLDPSRSFLIGARSDAGSAGGFFNGSIDEVGYFNTVLTPEDIEMIADYGLADIISGEAFAKAGRPNPADGAIGITQALLQWQAGDTAAFHDVYFGTNPTPGPDEFRSQLKADTTVYYHVAGLVPGTTYYWRIDEVEADGTTTYTGDVWSFTAPALSAWDPDPPDGAKWVQSDVAFSWNAGWNSIMYQVYLSPDLGAVTNGTAAADKGIVGGTSYAATGLDFDTTYYWRVDAFDDKGAWHTGDVWSFTTVGAYAGVKAQYYHHLLTRVDPGINFSWGDPGSPDPSVNVDDFSARWVADLEVAVSDTYTLWTYTDDGVMLWFDGDLVIDNWTDHGDTWNSSQPIALTAGDTHSIEMWWYERGGGATAQLHWSTATMSRQPIPPGPLSLPLKASRPHPANGAVDVKHTPTLSWSAGQEAAQHDVYLGTDQDAVANADTASAGIYRGRQALDATSYVPTESPLQWGATYYWRIDEVNGVDVWKGGLWRFTTANCLIVDDFEEYDDFCNRIFYKWKDGWGYSADADCGVTASTGNGTGSTVGNLSAPYAEQTIVHGGTQSMPYEYNNTGTGGKARYSEASLEFATPQNWTRNNVKALTLWFRGETGNTPETLYVALEDSAAQVRVATHPDPELLQVAAWQQWNVPLQQFSGVNLASIKKLYIGVGNRNNPQMGGSGKLYFDDIRIYPPRCVPSMAKPAADIAEPYDCKVGYEDVGVLADEWLLETQLQDWEYRAAYWDSRYRTNWATDANSITVRDGLAAAGYTILDADQLKTWMDARIADGKLSVVVFCRDNAPDTVVESVDATCTLRKYLDAGGKIVFYADIPFWDIAHADGTWDNPQTAGASDILGFDNTVVLWDSNTQTTLTAAGIRWGLTQTWASVRPIAATTDVTVLATDAAGNAAAWVRHYLPRDTARGFVRLWDRTGRPPVEDIIRVAESKGPLAANLYQDAVVDFKDFAVLADSWLDELWWP